MAIAPDLYAVLGVAPGAEADVIRAAWRALLRKYHPDHARDLPDAAERTREVNEAYAVLGNANRRIAYDLERTAPPEPPPIAPGDWIPPAYPLPPRRTAGLTFTLSVMCVALVAIAMTLPGVPGRVAAALPGDGTGIAHFARASLGQVRRLISPSTFTAPATAAPAPSAGGGAAPAVAPNTVALALGQLSRVTRRSGAGGIAGYSRACTDRAAAFATWEAQDFCVAFDLAANRFAPGEAETRYTRLGASPAAAAARITRIRKLLRREG